MSRVFKSDYIQIGTPKPIKNNITTIIKREPVEKREKTQEEVIKEAERDSAKIIKDAKEMYLKIIEEANHEAKNIKEKILIEAEAQSEVLRQEGYNEGYQAGFNQGLQDAQHIIEAALDIKDTLDSRLKEIYSEAEEQIMFIMLQVSRKIIGEELKQNKDAILSIIKQAIDKCAFKSKLILRVSLEDYDYVVENKNLIIKLTEGLSDLDILKDVSLQKGSCVVETPSGEINSSIEVQLRELEKAFIYALRNE